MHGHDHLSDDALLADGDPAVFERFYLHHVETLLGFFARRTRDPELAADLTAETFAAALAGRRRYRPQPGRRARGCTGSRCTSSPTPSAAAMPSGERGSGGMERLELDDDDYARIESLAEATRATALLEGLAPDQRDAVRRHVLEERSYAEIAASPRGGRAQARQRLTAIRTWDPVELRLRCAEQQARAHAPRAARRVPLARAGRPGRRGGAVLAVAAGAPAARRATPAAPRIVAELD